MTNVPTTTTITHAHARTNSSAAKPAPPLTTKYKHSFLCTLMNRLPSVALRWLLAAVAVVAALVNGSSTGGMTHLHLYIHQTSTGANASTTTVAGGCNDGGFPSFGSVRASDDELREGPDAASRYLGRAEGVLVQADLRSPGAWCTILCLVFTEGDYGGSTLVVSGHADLGGDGSVVVERGVVGGTGRFRWARGYSLMTKYVYGNTAPGTVVFEMDLYLKLAVV